MTTNHFIIETTCPDIHERNKCIDDAFYCEFSKRRCTEGKVKERVVLRKKCATCLTTGNLMIGFTRIPCHDCKGTGYIERLMTVEEAEEIGLIPGLSNIIIITIEELVKRKHVINDWTIDRLEVVE